jgi:hypothetical protein
MTFEHAAEAEAGAVLEDGADVVDDGSLLDVAEDRRLTKGGSPRAAAAAAQGSRAAPVEEGEDAEVAAAGVARPRRSWISSTMWAGAAESEPSITSFWR